MPHKHGWWKTIKENVLKRYHYRCAWCKSKKNLTIDHKIELYRGGSNQPSNLRVLCEACHKDRHAE